MVYRTEIEKALGEFISNEEGMKFQGLAVILAKQKWPDLIACERHNDLGLDAYAPASLATDKTGKGLACSTTPSLDKIKRDAKRAQENFDDLKVLIFATPEKITNQMAQQWADEIWNTFGYKLIVISREDIITSLMDPKNVSLCRTQLGMAIPIEVDVEELGAWALAATSERTANWLAHPRIAGRPLTNLRITRLTRESGQSDAVLSLNDIQTMLTECRRLVLEAPAGRGKTTSLIQLANLSQGLDALSFLIDLREWAESGQDILDFIICSPEFRSRNINAEGLAKLSKVTHFSFLLNGWNEISEDVSGRAEVALRNLERSFPTAGIIVATRNHHISPPLPGAIRIKLLPLCESQLPPFNRELLAKVIARMGTVDAILVGLKLIDDAAPQPVPYDLRRALERGFVEQRPHAKSENTFTLVPRSSNAIRSKLFEMALGDSKRRQSAFNLLGQIEVWRLDYGRSETEPRHPLFDSDEVWPLGLSR
jgi:hypothetical protein